MDFDNQATIPPINGSEDISFDQNVLDTQPGMFLVKITFMYAQHQCHR